MRSLLFDSLIGVLLMFCIDVHADSPNAKQQRDEQASTAQFAWTASEPIIELDLFGEADWIAMKDPAIVRHDDQWHLFCTLRGRQRSHAIVYSSFDSFQSASRSKPVILPNHDGYFCAPQVFYHRSHELWYLICQATSDRFDTRYQAAYATTKDLADPYSWSQLNAMQVKKPDVKLWLDFWVISDGVKMHMFATSDDGNMWRMETTLEKFPLGWSTPELAMQGDIFEASHIYKLVDRPQYLNVIEARAAGDRRYFKAYVADKLDGDWKPLADNLERAYASTGNVQQRSGVWTNSISHGEIIRSESDERMRAMIDDSFIFQGVLQGDRQGKRYGSIPWKLGLLTFEDP